MVPQPGRYTNTEHGPERRARPRFILSPERNATPKKFVNAILLADYNNAMGGYNNDFLSSSNSVERYEGTTWQWAHGRRWRRWRRRG